MQELFVPLVKKPEPPQIDVRADADKNMFGATVCLDGQPQGAGAARRSTTTPGRHLLEIKKEGFEPFSQWIEAKADQIQTIAPTLKEIAKPKYGTIIVDADVPDAEVYIDGNKHPDNTPVGDQQRDRGPPRDRGQEAAGAAVEADRAGHREPADQGPRRARSR